jgi:hypothetical protein
LQRASGWFASLIFVCSSKTSGFLRTIKLLPGTRYHLITSVQCCRCSYWMSEISSVYIFKIWFRQDVNLFCAQISVSSCQPVCRNILSSEAWGFENKNYYVKPNIHLRKPF